MTGVTREGSADRRRSIVSRSLGSRGLTLLDQGLSSLSNLLAVILVARSASAESFGVFALGYTMLTVTLALTRAYFGTRVALSPDRRDAHRLTRDLLGAVTLLAPLMVLVVFALSSLASRGGDPWTLLIVALATPLVCLQDVARYGAVSSGRPWVAVCSDGLWVLIMLAPLLISPPLAQPAVLAVWWSAAAVALIVALVGLRARPSVAGGMTQLRTRHRVGEATTWGAVIASGGALWILLVASVAISPAASGALRGAATTMGPLNVLIAFVGLGLTPWLVRRSRETDLSSCAACDRLPRPCRARAHARSAPPTARPGRAVSTTLAGAIAGLLVLAFTVELLRRRALREKYAAIWLLVSLAVVVFALFPSLLEAVASLLGFQVPANMLFAIAALVLLVIGMQLSWEIGRLEDRTQRLAEEIAILRHDLDELASRDADPEP